MNIESTQTAVEHVVLDVLEDSGQEYVAAIIIFQRPGLELSPDKPGDDVLVPMTDAIRDLTASTVANLQGNLLVYMVPTFFIPPMKMSFQSVSMELNRSTIRSPKPSSKSSC